MTGDIAGTQAEHYALVAHELRNPLESIRAMSRVLRLRVHAPDDARALAAMEQEAAAALALLDALTDMALIDSGHLPLAACEFELVAVVRRIVDAHQMPAHPVLYSDTGPVRVLADERGIGQVLRNLLSNAAKFSPDGAAIRVTVTRTADRAVVSVRDEGRGVPEAERPRLFQKFARLSTAGGTAGSGLGLYISRTLARGQGGDLWAEWPAEGGSVFRFAVPAA